MEHVTGKAKRPTGCLFEPPGKETSSKDHLLLYRDALALVMLNRFPYANGHLLVAPVRHVGDVTALTMDENIALMKMIQQSCRILRNHLTPHGFNIGLNIGRIAGAGIEDHLHFHVVPRWDGDHNYMTVTAEIRAIPQHIEDTFDMMVKDFQELLHEGENNG